MALDLGGRKELLIKMARQAGAILGDNFGRPLTVKNKEDWSLVTDIDIQAEKKILELIKKNFPEDDILSEEDEAVGSDPWAVALAEGFRWVIDPLDGTHNYIKKIPIFGTSIAVEFKNEVVLGAVYMPLAGEFYFAEKGKGAYCNDRRMEVSKRPLNQVTMLYDSTIRYNKKLMIESLGKIADKVFNIRMLGSTARSLSYLAEGKVDLEIEFSDKPWDFAAGLLLVEEAGGRATDLRGGKWNIKSSGYIASNGLIHDEVLNIIT
ncbi:MAG: inositol monophosphatase [Candidatus Omnitrophota bacterium]|nr:inositol monophosphatase [Candidatus Omnitrophota bacterium]